MRIKLAESNYARRFISVHGREFPTFVNFAPPEAQNRPASRSARALNYRVGQKSDTSRTLHYTVREVSLFWPTLYK